MKLSLTTLLITVLVNCAFSQPWTEIQGGSANPGQEHPASVDNWLNLYTVGVGRPVGSFTGSYPNYGDFYYNPTANLYPALLVHSMNQTVTHPTTKIDAILRLQSFDQFNPNTFVPSEVQFWSGEYRKYGEWQTGKITSASSTLTGITEGQLVGGGLSFYSRFNHLPIANPVPDADVNLVKTMSIMNGTVDIHDDSSGESDVIGKFQVNVGGWANQGSRIVFDRDQLATSTESNTLGPQGVEPTIKFYKPNGTNLVDPNFGPVGWLSLGGLGNSGGFSFATSPSDYQIWNTESHLTMNEIVRFRRDGKVQFNEYAGGGTQLITVDNDGILGTTNLSSGGGSSGWSFDGDGINPGDFIGTTDGEDFVIKTGDNNSSHTVTERIVVTGEGKVIIMNESSTLSNLVSGMDKLGGGDHLLGVDGSIVATEVKVALVANWPDYVFEEGYNIKTIEETEAFINANGHLPDVPSAKKIEENGIELSKMQALMMQKIEEMTLMIIDLNKKNKALEYKLNSIESK